MDREIDYRKGLHADHDRRNVRITLKPCGQNCRNDSYVATQFGGQHRRNGYAIYQMRAVVSSMGKAGRDVRQWVIKMRRSSVRVATARESHKSQQRRRLIKLPAIFTGRDLPKLKPMAKPLFCASVFRSYGGDAQQRIYMASML
jgi:hypothetical protein